MANTFYHSDVTLANGIHAAGTERELKTTTGTSADLQSGNISGGTDALTHLFTTVSGEPGFGTWPNGLYDTNFRVPTVGADITFGALTIGGSGGHFARVNTGLTAHVGATWTQTQGAFSGIGTHTASRTLTPPTGASTDRWEILLAAANNASMGNQRITVRVNTTESISTGPWAAPGQEDRGEPRMRILTPGSRINRADPLARDLQAYWLPRGNRVVDLTGHGHDGDFQTSGGAGGPGSSPRGPTLNHQSTGDFTQIADHPQLGGTPAALTIACVFWDAVAADVVDGVLMQKDDPATTHHWALEIENSSGFASFHMNTSSGGNQSVSGTRDVSNVEDQKVHVVMGVWDGANMRLYTDGVFEFGIPKTGTPSSSTEPINLGRHDDITSRRITGHILLWTYWRRGLSAGEAADFARDPFRVATRERLDAVQFGTLVTSTKLLRFDVVEQIIRTELLRLDLTGTITQTVASLFDLVEDAQATQLLRFDTVEQALQDAGILFDLTGSPVSDALLRFDTLVDVEQTQGARFDLATQVQQTAALLFDALERATQTGLLRFDLSGTLSPPKDSLLRFDTLAQVETTRGMRFDTLQRITQTAAALFDVLQRATGVRLLRFDLTGTPISDALLRFDTVEQVQATRPARFDLVGRATQTAAALFDLLSRPIRTVLARFDLAGALSPPKTATLRFDTVESAEATTAALFDLLERATRTELERFDLIGQPVATVPIRFDLGASITGTIPLRFDLLVQIEATELARFDTLEQAQQTIQARFDLLSEAIRAALLRFDLIQEFPVLRDALIRFDTLESIQAQAAILFDLLADVEATRTALFDTLEAVEQTAGLRLDLLGDVFRTALARFDTLGDVIRTSGARFDTLTRATQARPVRFDLIGQVEGTAGMRFDLQGTITKTGLIRFDLKLDVTITKDSILRFDTLELVTKDGTIRFDLAGGKGTGRELLALLGGIYLEGRSRQLGAK